MKKHLPYALRLMLYVLLICSLSNQSIAQYFGNEWINYQQQYFKITVVQRGIHRVNFATLKAAGFPDNIPIDRLQLFRKGKEHAIFTPNSTNFTAGDYFEFYAEPNDGTSDTPLYVPTTSQPHHHYSLFTDTSAYFITYRTDNQPCKRIAQQSIMKADSSFSSDFHRAKIHQLFTSNYAEGQPFPVGTSLNTSVLNSNYGIGKGWTGEIQKGNQEVKFTVAMPQIMTIASEKIIINLQIAGRSAGIHEVVIKITTAAQNVNIDTIKFANYGTENRIKLLKIDPNTTDKLTISLQSTSENDHYSISLLAVEYPQSLDMNFREEQFFSWSDYPTLTRRVILKNIPKSPIIYDISNPNHPAIVPFSTQHNTLETRLQGNYFLVTNQYYPIESAELTSFKKLDQTPINFLIITDKKLLTSAQKYAAYRASEAGGLHDTLTVNITTLYNQFSYGDKNPIALRNYLQKLASSTQKIAVFLIGTATYPQKSRKNTADFSRDLVPTWGFPCGDMPYIMDTNGYTSNLSIGRLATNNPQTILAYLTKVKEHEAHPMNALWRKKHLMMSGGRSTIELSILKEYIEGFKNISENGLSGLKTTILSKKSDKPVEFMNVTDFVNNGVGMITLFGHSAPAQADMDIGFCSNQSLGYHNQGKYPFVFVNGCDAGDVFGTAFSFGSDWINTDNRGAILFLAHTNLGYPLILKRYSEQLFHTLFADPDFVDKPFGEILNNSVNLYLRKQENPVYELANAQQFTLQGDPALVLFKTSKPDYSIDNNAIFIPQKTVISEVDSIKLGIIIRNLGGKSTQKLTIKFIRKYENGYEELFLRTITQPLYFEDTLFFTFPNNAKLKVGNNQFKITLDDENQLSELDETNNIATYSFQIKPQKTTILYPQNFAIIGNRQVNFVWQSPESVDNTQFIIQIDTNHFFKNPFTLTLKNLPLCQYSYTLPPQDSTVYYWRFRTKNDSIWENRSFFYLHHHPEGFAQISNPQFSTTTSDGQIIHHQNGWKFVQSSTKISAKIYGANSGVARPHRANSMTLNDKLLLSDGVCYPWYTINAVSFNRALHPYSVIPAWACGYTPYSINYLSADGNTQDLQDYKNACTAGNYSIFWNSGTLDYQNWTDTFRASLVAYGASNEKLKMLPSGAPFLIIGRKGSSKALLEIYPNITKNPTAEILSLDNFELNDTFQEGIITSPIIGPAKHWQHINLCFKNINPSNERYSLTIIGINQGGKEVVLRENITTNISLIHDIDAQQYPYLKLQLTLKTDIPFGQVPPFKHWLVAYESTAEGIATLRLNPTITTKQAYEAFEIPMVFTNISDKNFMDSIVCQQTIINQTQHKLSTQTVNLKPLAAHDSVVVKIPINTANWLGDNIVKVWFNPIIQPEQFYYNNVIEYNFKVIADQINPIMSITIDGKTAQNFALISQKPNIQISVQDENPFRILNDTTGIEIWLKTCSSCSKSRIYCSNEAIKYHFDERQKILTIDFRPQNILPNDTLTLWVQARDATGNLAGKQPYQIKCRTQSEASVKGFKLFPNPYDNFINFAFTLTGNEVIGTIQIEIFNQQGSILQTITEGSQHLSIGDNQVTLNNTFFTDLLPSGIYLYRFTFKNKANNSTFISSGKLIKK